MMKKKYLLDREGRRMFVGEHFLYIKDNGEQVGGEILDHQDPECVVLVWKDSGMHSHTQNIQIWNNKWFINALKVPPPGQQIFRFV